MFFVKSKIYHIYDDWSLMLQLLMRLCQVYSTTDIDLELPEYVSQSHEIYVFKNATNSYNGGGLIQAELALPVHLRYHQPQLDAEFQTVSLQPPVVMLHCTTCKDATFDFFSVFDKKIIEYVLTG